MQAEAGKPLKKRLWGLVIAANIRAQGAALHAAGLEASGFNGLARQVKSGDPGNLEAQAARRYWPLLMGPAFRRDATADGVNSLLNYGYAVLRGSTARGIVAAGLHPGLGIFHRHPHNSMPLADDLMEPFRPLVDGLVLTLVNDGETVLTPDVKRRLAGVLHAEQLTKAGRSPVETCIYRLAASLADSFLSGKPCLAFPAPGGTEPAGKDAAAT
jgi:CRISPR-associated protein Cas1